MQTTNAACLGLYEKALPADLSWPQRLATAAELGFEFVEMSIDEQPARQQRLDWDRRQRLAFIQARLQAVAGQLAEIAGELKTLMQEVSLGQHGEAPIYGYVWLSMELAQQLEELGDLLQVCTAAGRE